MGKLIAAINLTVDGFCDHTASVADDEIHQHYSDLIHDADAILFGRITYQLMESFWPAVVRNPTGDKAIDEFAVTIDNAPKVVFSNTLKTVEWKNTVLATEDIREVVIKLKEQPGKYIFAASRSLINSLMEFNLIDEYQFCVQPIILGSGLPLFKNLAGRIDLKLVRTKTFGCGAVILYYEPSKINT